MRTVHVSLLLVIPLLVVGCQSTKQLRTSGVDNVSFMGLWNTYSHCQKSEIVQELIEDAVVLNKATAQTSSHKKSVLLLPDKLNQLVSAPSARLAVDVKAMSAACSLRAAQAAAEVNRFDTAREVLEPILTYHPKSEYLYYTVQAKAILSTINQSNIQVSLNTPSTFIDVPSLR